MTHSAKQQWKSKTEIPTTSRTQVQLTTIGITTSMMHEYASQYLQIESYNFLSRKWTNEHQVPFSSSRHNPSIAPFGHGLQLVAYCGTDNNLYSIIYDPTKKPNWSDHWIDQVQAYQGIQGAVSLAYNTSRVYSIMKNTAGRLVVGTFDVVTRKWKGFKQLAFNSLPISSLVDPTIITLSGDLQLILFTDSSSAMHYLVYNTATEQVSVGPTKIAKAGYTPGGVVAAEITSLNQIMFAWRGKGTDTQVYYSFLQYLPQAAGSNQFDWTDSYAIPGIVSTIPVSLTSIGLQYYLVGAEGNANKVFSISCIYKKWYVHHGKGHHHTPHPHPGQPKPQIPFTWTTPKDVPIKGAQTNMKIAATQNGEHIFLMYNKLNDPNYGVGCLRFDPLSDAWKEMGDGIRSTKPVGLSITDKGSLIQFYYYKWIADDGDFARWATFQALSTNPNHKITLLSSGNLGAYHDILATGVACYQSSHYFHLTWCTKDHLTLQQTIPVSGPDKNKLWDTEFTVAQYAHGSTILSDGQLAGTIMPNGTHILAGYILWGLTTFSAAHNDPGQPNNRYITYFNDNALATSQSACDVDPLGTTNEILVFAGGPLDGGTPLTYSVISPDYGGYFKIGPGFDSPGAPTSIMFGNKYYLFWFDEKGQMKYASANMYS